MSASVTLRELVRIDVAKELSMTGRIMNGREASSMGLVTRCVDGDPMEEAIKVANEIVKRSPDSVAAAKSLLQKNWIANEKDALELETNVQLKLIGSWNQIVAAARNFGISVPYIGRKGHKQDP